MDRGGSRRLAGRVCATFVVLAGGMAALVAAAPPSLAGSPPTITKQPDTAVVANADVAGTYEDGSFAVTFAGTPTPTVQWQEAGGRKGPWSDIAGATGAVLNVTPSSANLGHAYQAVVSNAYGSVTSRPAKLVSKMDWMRDLGADIQDVPLTELTIPGTHDTGTYGASGNGDISKDHQTVACELGFLPSDAACQSWAKAQDRGIIDELNDGIRYFDLRVCGDGDLPSAPEPPNFVAISGEPVTCHELVSAKLRQILFQTADWAGRHPDEVVILDLNHHYQVDLDTEATQIETAFERDNQPSLMVPPEYCTPGDGNSGTCGGNLTLYKIRSRGTANVIVNFENDGTPGQERCFPYDGNPNFHPGCTPQYRTQHGTMPSFYFIHPNFWGLTFSGLTEMAHCTVGGAVASCFGNDSETPSVLASAKGATTNRQTFAEPHPAYTFQHFFVQFLQTTPDTGYILDHSFGSLDDMANNSNPVVGPGFLGCGDWGQNGCFAQRLPENVNILALNFYERHYAVNGQLFDFVSEVVKFDEYKKTAPVVRVAGAVPPAATHWFNAAVLGGQGRTLQVNVTADDYRYPIGISGTYCYDFATRLVLADAVYTDTRESTDFTLGDGVHEIDCTAMDNATGGTHQEGNRGGGPGSTQGPVRFSVDTTPPVITCPSPADSQLILNQPVSSITGTVTDATSGVASGTVRTPVSTAAVGTFTSTVTATDKAGNSASAVCTYTVSYRTVLRYDPTKVARSGSTIAVKVALADYSGKDVSSNAIGVTAVAVTATATGVTSAPTSPGQSGSGATFAFSPGDGYRFDLKTTGLGTGAYTLDFVIASDPVTSHAPFVIG